MGPGSPLSVTDSRWPAVSPWQAAQPCPRAACGLGARPPTGFSWQLAHAGASARGAVAGSDMDSDACGTSGAVASGRSSSGRIQMACATAFMASLLPPAGTVVQLLDLEHEADHERAQQQQREG